MLNDPAPAQKPTTGARPRATAPAPALATTTELDAAALQRLRDLDPTGANRLLARVFEAFTHSTHRLLPQMQQALEAGDHLGVRHVAHTLKSSSASVGALALSRLCAEIEAAARDGMADGLGAQVKQMQHETALVLKALQQLPGVL